MPHSFPMSASTLTSMSLRPASSTALPAASSSACASRATCPRERMKKQVLNLSHLKSTGLRDPTIVDVRCVCQLRFPRGMMPPELSSSGNMGTPPPSSLRPRTPSLSSLPSPTPPRSGLLHRQLLPTFPSPLHSPPGPQFPAGAGPHARRPTPPALPLAAL